MSVERQLLTLVLGAFVTHGCLAQEFISDILEETELVLAFLVHRHGDRTPVSSDMSFSNQPEALAKIVDKYGSGQLTPRGKYRGYQIGQFIRHRYSCLLSPHYNESEIYLRSTDVTRTKMTSLMSMAAAYPATEDNWSNVINWTPVPYTTVPKEIDYVFAFLSCVKYNNYYTTYKPEISQFQYILDVWSKITGNNFTDPFKVYTTYDDYYCQEQLGLPLESSLEAILPEIEKVAAYVMDAIFGNEEYLPLLTGVLLNEFFNAASTVISGAHSPGVRVYSAHEFTVYGMVAASMIQQEARPGVPKYGTVFGLELRKIKKTGQYGVLPLYVPDPDTTELLYLPIEGCKLLCDFESFKKITSKFVMDEDSWKQACGGANQTLNSAYKYFL